jgi:hypothetical protein
MGVHPRNAILVRERDPQSRILDQTNARSTLGSLGNVPGTRRVRSGIAETRAGLSTPGFSVSLSEVKDG